MTNPSVEIATFKIWKPGTRESKVTMPKAGEEIVATCGVSQEDIAAKEATRHINIKGRSEKGEAGFF